MASFNKVILVGNLTKDPELRFTSSGLAVANFSLAINRKTTKDGDKKEEVDFFDIETWDKQAELCSEYLSKGKSVLVEGRLKQDRWEDEAGNKRSRVKIVATTIQFLSRRSEEDTEGGGKGDFSEGRLSDGKDIAPF